METKNAKEIHESIIELMNYLSPDDKRRDVLEVIDNRTLDQMFKDVCDATNTCPVCGREKKKRSKRTYQPHDNLKLFINIPFMGCEDDECGYNKQEGEKAEYEYRLSR